MRESLTSNGGILRHLQKLLPPQDLTTAIRRIISVWDATELEISCREQLDSVTLGTYVSIRSKTIGLSPFFIMLEHAFCNSAEIEPARREATTPIRELQTNVSISVGLPNDIVGLERELSASERFNFVIRFSDQLGQSIGLSLCEAIDEHNKAVQAAGEGWTEIDSGVSSGEAREFADCILGFVRTHYLWASTAKRCRIPISNISEKIEVDVKTLAVPVPRVQALDSGLEL